MSYEKQTFVDEKTTLTAAHLDHIENGIYNNDNRLTRLENYLDVAPMEPTNLMTVRLEQGSIMTIRCKDWTDTEDFVWIFDGVGGQNKTANLKESGTILKTVPDSSLTNTMSKTLYKNAKDDTAPLNFKTCYFSGNHAGTIATSITVSSHSLTEKDIGSIWTDSDSAEPHEYMLAKITSGTKLLFINMDEEVISGSGPFNYKKHVPISPLTHVRNATNQVDIAFTAYKNSEQLWPGNNHVVSKYYVDDVEITKDGLYVGNKIHNVCSYDLIYIPAIIEYLENNVGENTNTSYYSDNITKKTMHMEVIHEFRPNGSQTTYSKHKIDSRENLTFSYIYTAQSGGFDVPTYFYIPGAFENQIITQDGSGTITFKPGDYIDANEPPYRYFSFNSTRDKGFEIAYSQSTYLGKPENRIKHLPSSTGWSASSCKLYPIFVAGEFNANSSFDSITGRIPLNMALNNGTTAIGWYWENDDIILTIDSHEQCSVDIPLSEYMRGKRVEVLDMTDSVISYPPYRTSSSLHYATNADIGYLVLRLHD